MTSLRDHQRGKHFMDDPYNCVCGKTFKWRMSMSRHKKKCKHCSIENDKGAELKIINSCEEINAMKTDEESFCDAIDMTVEIGTGY